MSKLRKGIIHISQKKDSAQNLTCAIMHYALSSVKQHWRPRVLAREFGS